MCKILNNIYIVFWAVIVLELAWLIYQFYLQLSINLLSHLWVMILALQLTLYLLSQCVIRKGINKKDKSLKVWWLCNLRIHDPYYKTAFTAEKDKKPESSKPKQLEQGYVKLEKYSRNFKVDILEGVDQAPSEHQSSQMTSVRTGTNKSSSTFGESKLRSKIFSQLNDFATGNKKTPNPAELINQAQDAKKKKKTVTDTSDSTSSRSKKSKKSSKSKTSSQMQRGMR